MTTDGHPRSGTPQLHIVRIDSFEGRDTFLRCGTESQAHLFAVIAIDAHGGATIVDTGYRTHAEAARAWRVQSEVGP